MSLAFDPCDDFLDVVDRLQPVTLTSPGSSSSTAVDAALRTEVTTAEARASQGAYTESDTVWHLPASDVASPPTLGDVIVDTRTMHGGPCWPVRRTVADSRWRCVCRNLAVVHGLDQYVGHRTGDLRQGRPGRRSGRCGAHGEPAWRRESSPPRSTVSVEHQRRVTTAEYIVYLAESPALDHTHRVKGPDGTVYQVTGCRKANRIDTLMEVSVVGGQ